MQVAWKSLGSMSIIEEPGDTKWRYIWLEREWQRMSQLLDFHSYSHLAPNDGILLTDQTPSYSSNPVRRRGVYMEGIACYMPPT